MVSFFGFLFVALIPTSIWGAVMLARRWANHWLARVLLGFGLFMAFVIAGITAILAGCSALAGPLDFR